MSEIQNSFQSVLSHWFLFAYLLVVQAGFAVLIARLLSDIQIDQETRFILSMTGGLLAFSTFCLVLVGLKIPPSRWLGGLVLGFAILVLLANWRILIDGIPWGLAAITLFFLCLLILRLVFIQGLLVPPYADSVQHYLIVQDFLQPDRLPQAFYGFSLNPQTYYHTGFHALAAWLSGSSSTQPGQAILILGQYFQATAVLAMYPFARRFLRSAFGAWGVMILTGFILPMPAYASNWGKYPAIASLTGLGFCMGLFVVLVQVQPLFIRPRHWALLFGGILVTIFLHSRVLLFLCAAFLLYTVFSWRVAPTADDRAENDYSGLLILAAVVLGIAVYSNFFVLYTTASTYDYIILVLFSITAFYAGARRTLALLAFVLLLGFLGLPSFFSPYLPVKYSVLMDQPFLEIILFYPFSLLIWLGLEGLILLVIGGKPEKFLPVLLTIVTAAGLLNVLYFQDQKPSSCCIFMSDDDLFSMEWMKRNLPENALVGIAATGSSGNFLPADGGAWIEPLTGIATRKILHTLDFSNQMSGLCHLGISYYYLDDSDNSFDEFALSRAGAEYLFGLGSVKIYKAKCAG